MIKGNNFMSYKVKVLMILKQKIQNRQLPTRQYENADKRYDIFEG